MDRRSVLCWMALFLVGLPAAAQVPKRDIDYRMIPQQPVETGGRVEVIDFFFYACPYCNELAPLLEAWLRSKPPDVVFRRVPVVRHDSWIPLAQVYYTLEAMGEAGRLHAEVFRSYHSGSRSLGREDVIAEWAQKHGVDRERFVAIYRSDETRKKIERARKMTMDYDIRSIPSIVVDGRYLTSSDMTPRMQEVITVLDGLIRLARERRRQGNDG